MQPILKGGFIMVNTKEMTESLIKELAFSEEELNIIVKIIESAFNSDVYNQNEKA